MSGRSGIRLQFSLANLAVAIGMISAAMAIVSLLVHSLRTQSGLATVWACQLLLVPPLVFGAVGLLFSSKHGLEIGGRIGAAVSLAILLILITLSALQHGQMVRY